MWFVRPPLSYLITISNILELRLKKIIPLPYQSSKKCIRSQPSVSIRSYHSQTNQRNRFRIHYPLTRSHLFAIKLYFRDKCFAKKRTQNSYHFKSIKFTMHNFLSHQEWQINIGFIPIRLILNEIDRDRKRWCLPNIWLESSNCFNSWSFILKRIILVAGKGILKV